MTNDRILARAKGDSILDVLQEAQLSLDGIWLMAEGLERVTGDHQARPIASAAIRVREALSKLADRIDDLTIPA